MRVAVLSDVHSNYFALEMVVADAKRNGVEDYWFLGDAVNYGWQPVETLQLLDEMVPLKNWIIGNHDVLYTCRLHAGDFRVEAQIMMNHNSSLIGAERKKSAAFDEFIETHFSVDRQTPQQKRIDGAVYFLTHDGFDADGYDTYYYFDTQSKGNAENNRTLFERIRAENVSVRSWKFWQRKDSDPRILFFGHTHVPVAAYLDPETKEIVSLKVRQGTVDLKKNCKGSRTIVINPGSVGFPKDRWHYPSYVILDTQKNTVEFCRVMQYDYRAVDQGYRLIKRNIEEYIRGGLWKRISSNNHHSEPFAQYDLGKITAQDYIGRIEQELLDAPHPRSDDLRPDFRKFYASDAANDFA